MSEVASACFSGYFVLEISSIKALKCANLASPGPPFCFKSRFLKHLEALTGQTYQISILFLRLSGKQKAEYPTSLLPPFPKNIDCGQGGTQREISHVLGGKKSYPEKEIFLNWFLSDAKCPLPLSYQPL